MVKSVMCAKCRLPSFTAAIAGVGTALFLWLASDSADAKPGAPSPEPVSVEEELLISSHPVGRRGGRLVTALRSEPKTLNPVVAGDLASVAVTRRLMANLVHINRHSQQTEPALARSWHVSEDGRRYTLDLRRGVRFSDGEPFDADDVLFTFAVYLDEAVASPNRDLLVVGGEPIQVRKVNSHTVEVQLAEPYAVGDRVFDGIAILPQHLLWESHQKGNLSEVWNVTTPSHKIAGLGPFRMKEYVPGQRCVLERNPYYWKVDQAGVRLPYLDKLTFLFVPNDDAQVVRFQAGETDVIDNLSSENFAALVRDQHRYPYRLVDLGPGLAHNFLFFNLNELMEKQESIIAQKQRWFRQLNFRKAVTTAIDREGIVRLVYQGRATPLASLVTPGAKQWLNTEIPTPRRSIAGARGYLLDAGFSWGPEQRLLDPIGKPVEFSIITSASNSQRVQIATIIQDDLKQLGMQIQTVPIEHRALVERVTGNYDYEACILGLGGGDVDPNGMIHILLSNGSLHLWALQHQGKRSLWEEEIDRLMRRQLTVLTYSARKEIFDHVQELLVENLPLISLVSPHVLVGGKRQLGNFKPVVMKHETLWNVEEIFWRSDPPRSEDPIRTDITGEEGSDDI